MANYLVDNFCQEVYKGVKIKKVTIVDWLLGNDINYPA